MHMQIGVVLLLLENPELGHAPRYREVREVALEVQSAGFDSIWVADHLLYRFSPELTAGMWEGWTILSALAEATSGIALGTLVMCVPFRNPAHWSCVCRSATRHCWRRWRRHSTK
jgi:alkanesulfonate monooxygenase SsuD/methylene tetrahydromethanopterin reductase-like flavin-dependent oxidoreductase (luciferase family)